MSVPLPIHLRYASRVALLACPFCREMYARGEERVCPQCGIDLERLEDLPPSPEVLAEEPPVAPELATLPFSDFRRGRGILLGLSIVGLVLFFFPWFEIRYPNPVVFTGLALASRKLFLLWATPVAWFVLIPTVLTRRSIYKMRGARVAVMFLAAFPGLSAMTVLLHQPRNVRVTSALALHVDAAPGLALYLTLALSVAALIVGARFGLGFGFKKAKPVPVRRTPIAPSSSGHTLH